MLRYWDKVNKNELVFITNNRSWTTTTVTRIYKGRWNIEAFFKLIKQNLKIKSFVGTSENAVQGTTEKALNFLVLMHQPLFLGHLLRYGINSSSNSVGAGITLYWLRTETAVHPTPLVA